jgi:hypothetical protein
MDLDIFEFMLEEGWDINAPVYGPRTALRYVSTLGFIPEFGK